MHLRSSLVLVCSLFLKVLLAQSAFQKYNEYVHYKSSLRIEHLTVNIDNRIDFRYNVSEFVENHQHVAVSWKGVYNPECEDHLALYVGDGFIDPKSTLPVQFVKMDEVSPTYLATGSGSAVFRLINLRADFRFMVVRGLSHPVLMGVGPPITNTIRNAPTSGHLGLHEDQRSLVVQWTSGSSEPQEVQWGGPVDRTAAGSTSGGTDVAQRSGGTGSTRNMGRSLRRSVGLLQTKWLSQDDPIQLHNMAGERSQDADAGGTVGGTWLKYSAMSTVTTYTATDMCGPPATTVGWLHPGYLHTAVIDKDNLLPDARYVYRYGSESGGWSAPRFVTSPPAPSSTRPFTFLAFNDVCQGNGVVFSNPGGMAFVPYGNNSRKLSPAVQQYERDVQLALLIGDLSYALGYAADWDYFGDQFEDIFTQWPLVTATGNHERDWPGTDDAFGNLARDSGGECNVPYHHRYYTPARAQYNDPRRSYYSFDFASVHFLILDSETDVSADSEQGRFVAADLAAVDRSKTPWLMVAMHRMMYAPSTDDRELVGDLANEQRLQNDLEDLFYQHKVDMVLQGHEHAYACTCKVYRRQCVEDGPIYVVAGHAGAGFTHGFPLELPDVFEFGVQDQNGYMRFQASSTVLKMEMVSADSGDVLHSVSLTKAKSRRAQ